jgi:uncharacterized protein (TIGR00661 family)
MRILYRVVGEGMGHAIRSRVVIEHLIEAGHEVEIMASSRAADALSKRFSDVHRIHGLHIISEENNLRLGKTLLSNVLKGSAGLPRQIAAYFEMTDDFAPEVVISDFESWSSLYGEMHRLPVISIDNMQIIDRCRHAPEILEGQRASYELARAFVRSKLPFSEVFFITTFFYPPIKRSRTHLVPPILRQEVFDAHPSTGDHLLVYQTSTSHDELLEALRSTGLECRIYGLRRDNDEDVVDGNLRFRPFSEKVFVDDLASARAVIASAGFTLMGECVALHKPLLAVPLGKQFEQVLNARYLEHEGYGMAAEAGVDVDTVAAFVNSIPRYEESLAQYSQNGNELLFELLDGYLDKAAAGLIELLPGRGSIDAAKERLKKMF